MNSSVQATTSFFPALFISMRIKIILLTSPVPQSSSSRIYLIGDSGRQWGENYAFSPCWGPCFGGESLLPPCQKRPALQMWPVVFCVCGGALTSSLVHRPKYTFSTPIFTIVKLPFSLPILVSCIGFLSWDPHSQRKRGVILPSENFPPIALLKRKETLFSVWVASKGEKWQE